MNNIPAAILQFERARKLDPDDEDINHNLALANLRVVDRVDPIPDLFYMNWWRKWSNLTSSNVWAGLAVGFLWLALLLFAALFLPYRSYLMRRILSSLALILLVLFVISVAARCRSARSRARAGLCHCVFRLHGCSQRARSAKHQPVCVARGCKGATPRSRRRMEQNPACRRQNRLDPIHGIPGNLEATTKARRNTKFTN